MGHHVPLILKCWVKCMKNVSNGTKTTPNSITADAVDFAAVMLTMHAETFVGIGQILKLLPWQQKWQHSSHNLINLWPS